MEKPTSSRNISPKGEDELYQLDIPCLDPYEFELKSPFSWEENISFAQHGSKPVEFNIQDSAYGLTYDFEGREEFIEMIHAEIGPKAPSYKIGVLSKLMVITGVSGIGKTHTVRKYITEYKKMYDHIIWINADGVRPATNCFLKLAAQINIDTKENGKHKQVSQLIEEIFDILTKKALLVVYDDAEQDKSGGGKNFLDMFLPKQLKQGRQIPSIIVTSRKTTWNLFKVRELPEFTTEECFRLFKAQLDLEHIGANYQNMKEITKICGGLPILIQQAITTIKDENEMRAAFSVEPYTLEEFLEDQEDIKSTLNQTFPDDLTLDGYVIWMLTFERLVPLISGELALTCLQVMSVLNPDHVPTELLKHLVMSVYEPVTMTDEDCVEPEDCVPRNKKFIYSTDGFVLELYEAMKHLLNSNLIINCGSYYQTHRMIQIARLEYGRHDSQLVIQKLISSFHDYLKSMNGSEQDVKEILENGARLYIKAKSQWEEDYCVSFQQTLAQKLQEVGLVNDSDPLSWVHDWAQARILGSPQNKNCDNIPMTREPAVKNLKSHLEAMKIDEVDTAQISQLQEGLPIEKSGSTAETVGIDIWWKFQPLEHATSTCVLQMSRVVEDFDFGFHNNGTRTKWGLDNPQKYFRKIFTDAIQKAYKDTGTFLLPQPGNDLILNSIKNCPDEEFQELLKEFVMRVMTNLATKSFGGNEISGEKFKEYVKLWVDLCKKLNFPVEQTVAKMSARLQNEQVIAMDLGTFKKSYSNFLTLPHAGVEERRK